MEAAEKQRRRKSAPVEAGAPGLPADYAGNPTVDPTENVKALVSAEKERSDDLRRAQSNRDDDVRALESKFFDYAIASIKEWSGLQHAHNKDIGVLRANHAKELRDNDIAMQANIRQVDIINSNASSRQTETAITTLAKSTAEQASALAEQLSATNARYEDRLRMLESGASKGEGRSLVTDPAIKEMAEEMKNLARSVAGTQGRQAVTDPAIALMAEEMKKLAGAISSTQGRDKGIGMIWAVVVAVVGMAMSAAVFFK